MRSSKPGDVVIIPFPFTDPHAAKRRPALVLSTLHFNRSSGHLVLAMITTAPRAAWPGDFVIHDLRVAGLPAPSMVRWKLFSLDALFVIRRAGALSHRDRVRCRVGQPLAL